MAPYDRIPSLSEQEATASRDAPRPGSAPVAVEEGAPGAPSPRTIGVVAATVIGIAAVVLLLTRGGTGTPPPATTTAAVAAITSVASANAPTPIPTVAPTSTTPPMSTPVPTAILPATTVPSATPDAAAPWIADITSHRKRGEFEQAATEGEAALLLPLLNQAQAAEIARGVVGDWRSVLDAAPVAPGNRTAQDGYVAIFRQHIEPVARRYGIRLAYLADENAAFQRQQFPLAGYLFTQAVSAGEISVNTPEQQARGYAIMTAIGWWYTQDPKDDGLTRDGTRYLYTAEEIAAKYGFGNEATNRLQALYGPNRATWPKEETVPTPLLSSTKGG